MTSGCQGGESILSVHYSEVLGRFGVAGKDYVRALFVVLMNETAVTKCPPFRLIQSSFKSS